MKLPRRVKVEPELEEIANPQVFSILINLLDNLCLILPSACMMKISISLLGIWSKDKDWKASLLGGLVELL